VRVATGAPGAGKTSILRLLAADGYSVVGEAATAVIAAALARGEAEPWTKESFIDEILAMQRSRQAGAAAAAADNQVFDRSPVCTHALARYLGRPVPAALADEITRITRDRVYERHVFFIRNLGFELIDVPAGPLAGRAVAIRRGIAALTRA
jgi:predicted ATPase